MREKIFVTVLIFASFLSTAQVIEKPIAKLSESQLRGILAITVDPYFGDYYIACRDNDTWFYTVNGTDVPMKYMQRDRTIYGDVHYMMNAQPDENWYYKNSKGTKVYGPMDGRRLGALSANGNDVAIVVNRNDTLFFYMNSKLVYKRKAKTEFEKFDSLDPWAVFSPDGKHCIYKIEEKGLYKLYKDYELLASGENNFYNLQINNKGDILYAEVDSKAVDDHMFDVPCYLHYGKNVFNVIGKSRRSFLSNSGDYCIFGGDLSATEYGLINGTLLNDISPLGEFNLLNNGNFFLAYYQDGKLMANGNGRATDTEAESLSLATIDAKGNYSFFGQTDNSLYKYVNGIRDPKPLSAYGITPTPVYISPEGESIVCYKTDDIIYIHKDNKVIHTFPNKNFTLKGHLEYYMPWTHKAPPFHYITAENKYYLLYKDILWESPVDLSYNGAITHKIITQDNIALVFRIEKGNYGVIINNSVFAEVNGIDTIVEGNCTMTDKELVFFGIKGNILTQFNVKI